MGCTPQTDTGPPVACTLAATDLAAQASRWKRLAARAMDKLVTTEDGVRIIFVAHAGVETELRALANIEAQCCSWARWSVESAADRVTLVARSARAGIPTLQAMFADLPAPAA